MLNLTTTANESSPPESATESLTEHQYSAISPHSLIKDSPQAIREWLMSSAADSRVSPSVTPANKREAQTSEICGPQCSVSSAWYDHDLHLWRTSLDLFPMDTSTESLGILPKAGMTVGGVFYQQPKWELRISEIGSGWSGTDKNHHIPTPSTMDHANLVCTSTEMMNPETNKSMTLNRWIGMWPSPSAQMAGEGELMNKATDKDGGPPKQNMRVYNPETGKHIQVTLNRAERLFPTPQATEARQGMQIRREGKKGTQESLTTVVGGQLNPEWVAWLMGVPIEWLNLQPLAICKYQSWLQQHGGC